MAHMLRLTPCHSLTALPLHAVPRLYVLRLFVQCAQFERPDPNVSSTVLRHFGKRLFRLLRLSAIVIACVCSVQSAWTSAARSSCSRTSTCRATTRPGATTPCGRDSASSLVPLVCPRPARVSLARSLADRRASQAFRPSSCSCCSTTASAEANRRCNSKSDSSTSVRAFCSICLNPLNLSRVCCL